MGFPCRFCGMYIDFGVLCNQCQKSVKTGSVLDLLMSAAAKEQAPPEYSFSLQGDLNQMGIQKAFLLARGYDIKMSDVYPCVKREDEEGALWAIWESRVPGWWHYQKKMEKYGICTLEEWNAELGKPEKNIAPNEMTPEFKKTDEKIVMKKTEVAAPRINRKIRFNYERSQGKGTSI